MVWLKGMLHMCKEIVWFSNKRSLPHHMTCQEASHTLSLEKTFSHHHMFHPNLEWTCLKQVASKARLYWSLLYGHALTTDHRTAERLKAMWHHRKVKPALSEILLPSGELANLWLSACSKGLQITTHLNGRTSISTNSGVEGSHCCTNSSKCDSVCLQCSVASPFSCLARI